MCAIDLPSEKIKNKLIEELYRDYMVILGCGKRSLRFRPPLNVSKEEIDKGLDILKRNLK